jgi:ketosteroid isomerase-like protein
MTQRFTVWFLCIVAIVMTFMVTFFERSSLATAANDADSQLGVNIEEILQKQSEAWNQGDIDGFMQAYWKNEGLTFSSGGKTTRGWTATFENYKNKYPDKQTMGTLEFSNLETRTVGPDAALTLGNWFLKREAPIGGNFSLVWQKFEGKWQIVHDHTSVAVAARD